MTRSELADLRLRAERFIHIFGPESAAGKIVSQLLTALDQGREAVPSDGEKVS